MQRVLLGATAVCATLSVIPPLRLGASLALRSISLLSAASAPADHWFIRALRVGIVALGLIGLAASLPVLLKMSLAVDMGYQLAEAFRELAFNKEYFKGLVHLGVFAIDTLALLGFILGSWQLMVASAAVSAAGLVTLGITAIATKTPDVALSLFTLAGASLAGAIMTAEIHKPARTTIVKNNDPNQRLMTTLPIGPRGIQLMSELGKDLVVPTGYTGIMKFNVTHITPDRVWTETVPRTMTLVHSPLPPALFGTVPVGGPSLTAVTSTLPTQEELRNGRWQFGRLEVEGTEIEPLRLGLKVKYRPLIHRTTPP